MMMRIVKRTLRLVGIEVSRTEFSRQRQMDPAFWPLAERCRDLALVSTESLYHTFETVAYVTRRRIPGAWVECGVWKGGSALMAALAFRHFGEMREMYLFDTYAGMPATTAADDVGHHPMTDKGADNTMWEPISRDRVQAEFRRSDVDGPNVHYVEGMVEETIPHRDLVDPIAILRLDTDFHASTAHALAHLEPQVSAGGVVIANDYGWWKGSRRAVDEYYAAQGGLPMLHWIDFTERSILKTSLRPTSSAVAAQS